jgi:hypothetical protein
MNKFLGLHEKETTIVAFIIALSCALEQDEANYQDLRS